MSNLPLPDDSWRGRIETEVDGLKTAVLNLSQKFETFIDEIRKSSRTPWGVLLSAFGALVVAIGLISAPYLNDIKRNELYFIEMKIKQAVLEEQLKELKKVCE